VSSCALLHVILFYASFSVVWSLWSQGW
jgi:hypothetical protein